MITETQPDWSHWVLLFRSQPVIAFRRTFVTLNLKSIFVALRKNKLDKGDRKSAGQSRLQTKWRSRRHEKFCRVLFGHIRWDFTWFSSGEGQIPRYNLKGHGGLSGSDKKASIPATESLWFQEPENNPTKFLLRPKEHTVTCVTRSYCDHVNVLNQRKRLVNVTTIPVIVNNVSERQAQLRSCRQVWIKGDETWNRVSRSSQPLSLGFRETRNRECVRRDALFHNPAKVDWWIMCKIVVC